MFGKEIAYTSRLGLCGRAYAFFWGFPLIGPRVRSYHVIKLLKTVPEPADILDVGCGIGNYCFYLSEKYPGAKITGIDCDAEAIRDANAIRERLNADNIDFIIQDSAKIQFERCFDLVILIDVLEHIEDDGRTIKNLFNALKVDGNILIHVPKRNDIPYFTKNEDSAQSGHVRRGYAEKELKDILQKNGFKILFAGNTFGFFGSLAYQLENSAYNKSKLLLKMIFPLLLCLARMDAFIKNREGNGLLVFAKKQ